MNNREMDGEGKETDNLVVYSRTIDRTYTRRINQIWLQVREESRNCSQRERKKEGKITERGQLKRETQSCHFPPPHTSIDCT